jgi:hypothetical protein
MVSSATATARRASPSELVYGRFGGDDPQSSQEQKSDDQKGDPANGKDAAADEQGALVVEDGAQAKSDQMTRSQFLDELKTAIAADGAPVPGALDQWATMPMPQLETKLQQMVPEAAQVKTAHDLVAPVAKHVADEADKAGPGAAAGALARGGNLDQMSAFLGGGQPLDSATRGGMEQAFNHGFGDVRVHAGERGAAMAGALGARAFAFGSQIAFGGGQYQPGTPMGDALLAHELAHVVQQQGQPAAGVLKVGGGESAALDHDADQAATAAVQGIHARSSGKAVPMLRSGVGIQRCPDGASATAPAPSVSISTSTISAATWKPHGEFKWWVQWNPSGKSGWIVQKVTNTYSGTDGSGTAITNASVGATPSYWEAWAVDATGKVTASPSLQVNRDQFERPNLGAGSKGQWSMQGDVFWTTSDPATSGMSPGGVGNAGVLLSSTSAPGNLSSQLLTRTANGQWDDTASPAVAHHGAASP